MQPEPPPKRIVVQHVADASFAFVSLGITFALTLAGFTLYALCTQTTPAILSACGEGLWRYVLVSLVLMIFFVYFYGTIVYEKDNPCFGIACWCVVLAYNLSMLIAGAKVTSAAMDNGECVSALSAGSFTHTPLLAILGYFYVAINAYWFLQSFFDVYRARQS